MIFASFFDYRLNMKKQIGYLFLAVSMTFVILSCGRWSDNIKLSARTVIFKSAGDSTIITTKGDWWWLTGVTVDTKKFYDFGGIDVIADNYIVKMDCFTFERRDKNTIFIKLDPNPNNLQRVVVFELEAGDYFDRITITQNSE
jgi:hypothetical protein